MYSIFIGRWQNYKKYETQTIIYDFISQFCIFVPLKNCLYEKSYFVYFPCFIVV
jgi:hypothetical protein